MKQVSGTVTSQARGLPRVQSTRVAPSALFPSCLRRPIDSLLAGIWAFFTALQRMSLSCEWRMWRGVLLRHARPWSPLASTVAPHMHVWGWHKFVPMRIPAATRMASSDSLRPTAVNDGACSQSPNIIIILLLL